MKVANGWRGWAISSAIYTASGLASAAAIGALIAAGGNLVLGGRDAVAVRLIIIVVAISVAVTDLGYLKPILLVPRRRQTSAIWPRLMPEMVAAAAWGLDLGLAFNARLAFAGPWLLAAIAAASGSFEFGALLFVGLWFGRVLPLWMSPFLLRDANDASRLGLDVAAHAKLFEVVELLGVAAIVAIALGRLM